MPAAKSKSKKPLPPAIPVKLSTLTGLLGKLPKDPAVVAAMAKWGKVQVSSDFIEAKEAGFDFSLDYPVGPKANRKVLSSLFLFGDGVDGHRGYRDLPAGFAFATRAELLAQLPVPEVSWKIGKGKVPVATPGVSHDQWTIGGLEISANYRSDAVGHFNVQLPEDATGGADLSTYPLHFETKPADAPPDAELVGMALLVAWAAERFGLPAKHAGKPAGAKLIAKEITPRTFLVEACESTLSTLDFDPKLKEFLTSYTSQPYIEDDPREKHDAKIAKLLDVEDADRRTYNDDFLGTFRRAVDNPFHVPDSWDAVARIAPVLDARLADFQATGFTKVPDIAVYERAVKLRDARKVTAARAALAPATVDAKLAEDLVGLIGKPLTDKEVKAVLARAGMPVGKRIDQQANPALGVAYMGTKIDIGGKRQLGVDAVWFFAQGQKSYIRGIGAEVEFVGYPGPLPRGLELGESRASVAKKLGKPKSTYDDHDYWQPSKDRRLSCEFAGGKLVEVYFGTPKDY